jgi:hypothetical protein
MLVVLVAVNTTKAMKSRSPYFYKALQRQEERKLQKHQGRKRNETKKRIARDMCDIFSMLQRQPALWRRELSFCMASATFRRYTLSSYMVLQDFADNNCSRFELNLPFRIRT